METGSRNARSVTDSGTRLPFRAVVLLLVLFEATGWALFELLHTTPEPVVQPVVVMPPPAPVAPPVVTPPPPAPVTPPPRQWQTVVALVTAYTPGVESCGDSADGRTSTNRSTDTHPYGIAADGAVLPPGSLIKVPEYMDVSFPDRAWEIDDTGGAMRQSFKKHFIVHLDLRYRTVFSANKLGRQWMEVDVDVTDWKEDARERLRIASANGWKMREQERKATK